MSEVGTPALHGGGLGSLAEQATSPGVERAIGILLGADEGCAAAVVTRLVEAGRLAGGLAVPVLVLAARRGTDAAGAAAEIAGGHALPESWSAYELRAAADEAKDDLHAGLRRAHPTGPEILAVGADAPGLVAAAVLRGGAGAVRCGAAAAHVADGLSLRRAVIDHAFVERLAGAAGLSVRERDVPDGAVALAPLLADAAAGAPPDLRAGLDEVVVRDDAYLGLL